jgi:hypothetical protein
VAKTAATVIARNNQVKKGEAPTQGDEIEKPNDL